MNNLPGSPSPSGSNVGAQQPGVARGGWDNAMHGVHDTSGAPASCASFGFKSANYKSCPRSADDGKKRPRITCNAGLACRLDSRSTRYGESGG